MKLGTVILVLVIAFFTFPILNDNSILPSSFDPNDIGSFVIAIDKRTGYTVWRTPRDEFTRSYSTPVVWEAEHLPSPDH